MTLDELKAAWDAAAEKSKAAPDDAKLKSELDAAETAYNEAKAAEDAKHKNPEVDESKWDEKTKAYITRLRGESASHRTKNKELASSVKTERERVKAILKAAGIESEDEKPEETIKKLTHESQTKDFRLGVLESAVQNGIAADDVDYYEYLVAKAVSDLGEGEELTEEKMTEIIAKVKKASKGPAKTSVNGGGGKGGGTPPPGESGEVSLDKFVRMTITQKSDLYLKHPEVYATLLAEAKAKKKLV